MSNNVYVYIATATTLDDDQSGENVNQIKAQGYNKSFHYGGVTYTLNPGEVKPVPEVVGKLWAAADAQVLLSWDGFRAA